MKKIVACVLSLLSVGLGVNAAPVAEATTLKSVTFDPADATVYGEKGFNVGFELGNRGKDLIWFQVFNGDAKSPVSKSEGLRKGEKLSYKKNFAIDISKRTYLFVWYSEPTGDRLQKPDRVYSFSTGSTLYLTWDPSGDALLRPTKGRLGGIFGGFGKTESGLSLKKNIPAKDIFVPSSTENKEIVARLTGK
ncbi:hypothetical protein H0X06_00185 [Candidatus Dependentiae bacterium]|nr:hypothetical protein [Candidatus Dependentiae bacterium]